MEQKTPNRKSRQQRDKIWRMTEATFWKVAGEMFASRDFIQTSLFKATHQEAQRIKRQIEFMVESEMILEVTTIRGVTYTINEQSPFWRLFQGKSPRDCRKFWRDMRVARAERTELTLPPDDPTDKKVTKQPSPALQGAGCRLSEGESNDE
jgi:hypothetical protein